MLLKLNEVEAGAGPGLTHTWGLDPPGCGLYSAGLPCGSTFKQSVRKIAKHNSAVHVAGVFSPQHLLKPNVFN